jgi:signal recognition particle subunit SRP54
VQEVNQLLKQYLEMNRMMKQIGKLGKRGLMRHGLPGLPPRG